MTEFKRVAIDTSKSNSVFTLHWSITRQVSAWPICSTPETVGVGRGAFGMPLLQSTLDGDGKLKAIIGAAGQKTLMSQQRWVDVFNAAGLPAVVERNLPL